MFELQDVQALQAQLSEWRAAGESIGFVPTMGFLHEGHMSLIRIARQHATRVVVSIFVNPTQFGPNEDLEQYPRDPEGDCAKIKASGGDLVFMPSVETLYPEGAQTYVEVKEVSMPLCGVDRPTHFRGVATIVTKFFNLVRPDVAVFGEKDFQQLALIRRMVRDLHFPVRVIGGITQREEDGLALSSRNAYLDAEQRQAAVGLSQSIRLVRQAFAAGEVDPQSLLHCAMQPFEDNPLTEVQYIELRSAAELTTVERNVVESDRLFLAVRLGNTRLIDNAPVGGDYPL